MAKPDPLAELRKFFEASLINWSADMKERKEATKAELPNEDEFYIKYRPKTFKQVKGQREAVNTLKALLKKKSGLPHGLLFTGPSGCGKTTFAYILKTKIDCGDSDFYEYDVADFRGIDTIRDMRQRIKLAPISGKKKIYLLDEAHQLTSDAQNALLKLLEKCPKHVYIMLATTEPNKLKNTIHTRCTQIKVDPLARGDMEDVIAEVCDREKLDISEKVVAKIVQVAEGSARKALVLLNQVSEIEGEAKQLTAVLNSDAKVAAIEIARALIAAKPWPALQAILRGVDEDPEQIRQMMLGYCTTVMLSGNKRQHARAFFISQVFRDDFYSSKRNGLVQCCMEVCNLRPKRR